MKNHCDGGMWWRYHRFKPSSIIHQLFSNFSFRKLLLCISVSADIKEKNHKVYWNDDIGLPYMVLGKKYLDCQYGKDRQKLKKEKGKAIRAGQRVSVK